MINILLGKEKSMHRSIETLDIKKKLLEVAMQRGDELGFEVVGRLQTTNDLVAEEACYHVKCYVALGRKGDKVRPINSK